MPTVQINIEQALSTLGDVLESRGVACEIVVVGGGALQLLGLIARPTKDLDVVALVRNGKLEGADPFPPDLARARDDVANALGIPADWLNPGPTALPIHGLPEGFDERVTTRTYGSLTLRIAGRVDQIFLKLYAAVDQGPRSKHMEDLRKLSPAREELLAATRWARGHDPSPGFREISRQALLAFDVEEDDGAR
jgi:hypothetical protein